MVAIAGKIASRAKKATPPEVDRIRSSEIPQSMRQRMSFQPRAGISPGVFASRPRPGSRAWLRSSGSTPAGLASSSSFERQSSPCSFMGAPLKSSMRYQFDGLLPCERDVLGLPALTPRLGSRLLCIRRKGVVVGDYGQLVWTAATFLAWASLVALGIAWDAHV